MTLEMDHFVLPILPELVLWIIDMDEEEGNGRGVEMRLQLWGTYSLIRHICVLLRLWFMEGLGSFCPLLKNMNYG